MRILDRKTAEAPSAYRGSAACEHPATLVAAGASRPGSRRLGWLFAATVFVSAFLLFQVQPLIGKVILPWFGSAPSVWTTCMLFFQLLLLGGYAYSHLIASRLSRRRQGMVHLVLLGAALAWLPLAPDPGWRPSAGDEPSLRILLLLAATVGLPYFALSATGPLLQSWFAATRPGDSPYRLYALSNAGSLIALLSYPFIFEPRLRLQSQTLTWSIAFAGFVLLCGACAWRMVGKKGPSRAPTGSKNIAASRPRPFELLLWLALSACGSALLLATTNQMCLDIAVVPFLWVLPMTLYLLSFVLCFDSSDWYSRPVYMVLLPLVLANVIRLLDDEAALGILEQVFGYSAALFVCCMCCHGELSRRKPAPAHLTLFFLMLSLGGALGGVFVAVAAPAILDGFYEYQFLLAAVAGFMVFLLAPGRIAKLLLGAATVGGLAWVFFGTIVEEQEGYLARERNFYGVVSLFEHEGPDARLELEHGRITHGFQLRDHPDWPTSYFGPPNGIGVAIRKHPQRQTANRQFRIGVIGLGAGTIAAYANARIDVDGSDEDYVRSVDRPRPDHVCFYEINPLVAKWADEQFTYLSDARRRGADVDVRLGDARIVMERELERGERQAFDVLAIDAFSGDAIPIHLLTKEAMEVYWQHLAADGVLAIHISNRYVDLLPVVRRFGREFGKRVLYLDSDDQMQRGVDGASWVLLTNNRQFVPGDEVEKIDLRTSTLDPLWTDDFASLFGLIAYEGD